MAPRSVLWELFHTNNQLYKTDKSHHNAFCIGCTKLCTDGLRSGDTLAVASGELNAVRRNKEIQEAGKQILALSVAVEHLP